MDLIFCFDSFSGRTNRTFLGLPLSLKQHHKYKLHPPPSPGDGQLLPLCPLRLAVGQCPHSPNLRILGFLNSLTSRCPHSVSKSYQLLLFNSLYSFLSHPSPLLLTNVLYLGTNLLEKNKKSNILVSDPLLMSAIHTHHLQSYPHFDHIIALLKDLTVYKIKSELPCLAFKAL